MPGAAVAVMITTGLLLASGGLPTPSTSAEPERTVELPEPLGEPAELTDEQRAALEAFDPERVRCEPRGCASWRWRLDGDVGLVAVDHGWLAVLDGTTVRVRALAPQATPPADAPQRPSIAPRSAADRVGGGSSWEPGPTRRDIHGPPDLGTDVADEDAADHELPALLDHLDVEVVGTRDGAELPDLRELAATSPQQLRALDGGAVLIVWPELVLLVDLTGEVVWARHDDEQPLRHLEVAADHLVVYRDEAPWPPGASAPGPSPAPIIAAGHDLTTGEERWRRSSRSQLGTASGGVLIEEANGDLHLLEVADGSTRWVASATPHQHVQMVLDPWIVSSAGNGTVLIDANSGEVRSTLDRQALLSPLQRIGDLWLGVWLEQPTQDGALTAAMVALDEDGEERWRRSVASPNSGRCCTAALDWRDGAVVLYDPGNHPAPWLLLDAATGEPLGSPEENELALPLPTSSDQVVTVPGWPPSQQMVQQQQAALGLLHPDGIARVTGDDRLHVVATEPFIVRQGRELVGIEPFPTDERTSGNRLPRPMR